MAENEYQEELKDAITYHANRGLTRREIIKKTSYLVAAAAVAPILAACGTSTASASAVAQAVAGASGPRLKMFATGEGLVISFVAEGKRTLEQYCQLFNVDLTYADGELDPTKQRAAVDNVADQKWDIAAVTPVEAGTLVAPFQKMASNGCAVIEQITPVGAPGQNYGALTICQQDSYEMGFKVTSQICAAANGTGTIIETRGPASHQGSIARHAGFTDALKNYPNMQTLTSDFGNWDTTLVHTLWETYINRYPTITAAYAHNDDMALAIVEALTAAGRKALVGGCDGMPSGIQAVKDGKLAATMRHSTVRLNMYAVVIGQAFKRGIVKTVPSKVVVDGLLVTPDNAESLIFLQGDGIFLQ
ncbi:MAG: sugar ABC transporter substrate-binding protein [Acidimicrobiales bacterium]